MIRRRGRETPDRARLLRAARLFVAAIGERDLRRDQARTPARVADAWSREILSGYRADPARILATSFRSRESGMVVVRDIPFVSVCVHHLLPFHGNAAIAYLPGGRLAGEAEHLCMTIRGPRTRGARVVTSAFSGAFRGSPSLRAEFLRQCGPPGARARRAPSRSLW